MEEGEESKKNPEAPVEIQERGEIFFLYRPKVGKEEVHGAEEVQRLYIVLKQDPASGKEGAKKKKKDGCHPDTSKSSSDSVASEEGGHGIQKVKIEDELLVLVEDYDTSTRGHRHNPPARATGEGVYRILRHNPGGRKMHTRLIYKLEFPPEDGDLQETLNIDREASFLIQIKNPELPENSLFRGLQRKRKASFPAHLQGGFGRRRRRFLPLDPPDFLNYEGCEFLLIAASDDVEGELGVELTAECSDLVETASIAPLLKGTWA